jgi:hypothetical protein
VEEAPTSPASPPSIDLKNRQNYHYTVAEKDEDLMSALAWLLLVLYFERPKDSPWW